MYYLSTPCQMLIMNQPDNKHFLTQLLFQRPFLDSGTIAVPANISDHKATYITLPFQYDTEGVFNRLIFSYKRAKFTILKQKISNFDWTCLREGTLDEACSKFNKTFLNFVNLCVPSKNVLIRPDDKPWYDCEIRRVSR